MQDIFFYIAPNPVEVILLSKLNKEQYLDTINELLPHATGEYSDLEDSLVKAMIDWNIITMKDIDNIIDSFTKKQLCNLWKKIFEEGYEEELEEKRWKEEKKKKRNNL